MSTFYIPRAAIEADLSDEGGHPVVQLHGLTSSRYRDRLLDLDLGRGLSGTRLLRYDARGHGHSSGEAVASDYAWHALAGDLLYLLDSYFPGERVHGVGPSMGTGTLLHAAVREPDRFSGLTLLLPPTAWETRVAQAEEYERTARFIEEHGLGAWVRANAKGPRPPATVGHPEPWPEVAERILPAVFRGAALSDLPEPERIAAIEVPVTVLAWVEDPAHPLSTAETLVDLLPNAELVVAHNGDEVSTWPRYLTAAVARG